MSMRAFSVRYGADYGRYNDYQEWQHHFKDPVLHCRGIGIETSVDTLVASSLVGVWEAELG